MDTLIELSHIKKTFGKLQVLKDISCHFESGNIVSVLGPNASGKTTMIKSILGMVIPDEGDIRFCGARVNKTFDYKKYIGYMPQIGRYPDNMKIGQLFDMMLDIRNCNKIPDTDLIEAYRLKSMYHKPMRTLSGGTRQKVSAALAFMFNPDVLILDEPTAGLDPFATEILKQKILAEKANNRLVIITSHILSESEELADTVMYLYEGKIKFYEPLAALQMETGEQKLGKILTRLLTEEHV
ncbi:ABC transporter ATP-binding protein [Mucilaginibacter sp. P25]|uniref:Cu-processing system ATP-binding protein n=1 Tax=Mucilaginibacter gossypii TaxID=551996 RepID=A0A1G7T6W7_9SPHI|nr:ABC transporter ATP-binding protein [Mucilaginibacter gossypii]SDG30764.1 Cu-processing system ATP-binding protein [Mucilaginibacter gossypii]